MKFYELPDVLPTEIKRLDEDIKSYRDGDVNPIAFKGIRVQHGVYEQRKFETYMIRIRCAGSAITPKQLKKVAEISHRYGAQHFHTTTRMELQLHYVDLDNVTEVYNGLIEVGLSSRGGGGNTIRNIMASDDSGISLTETFDVTPYACALTTRLISESDSWNLPRKFKIAFSNSDADTAQASITCLGFIAKIQNGQKGFKVYVCGGMGAKPMLGRVLFDFVADDRVYTIAKAIKILFDKHGDRRRKYQNRIKFLWEKLGETEFRRVFNEEYEILQKIPGLELKLPLIENKAPENIAVLPQKPEGDQQYFDLWKKRYVKPQKQAGLFAIKLGLHLGDIDNEDGVKLAELLEPFGDNTIRITLDQNLLLRNIPEAYIGNIYNGIMKMRNLSALPAMIANMISCTGADTCKLGICLPRGVIPEIADRLLKSSLNLDAIPSFKIHVSGCPNTCGRHHAADLGFFGKVGRTQGGDSFPAYNVMGGAQIKEGAARFAEKIEEVCAKHVPQFVQDLLEIYISKKSQFVTFLEYLENGGGKNDVKFLAEKYRHVPALAENKEYYFDWGSPEPFSLLKGQKAECCAGVFDMIDVDVAALKQYKEEISKSNDEKRIQELLHQSLFSASRMLLVTRGIEARNEAQIFQSFLTHFIEAGLVPEGYRPLLEIAKAKKFDVLLPLKNQIFALGDHMSALYKNMDDSLKFQVPEVCKPETGREDNTPSSEKSSEKTTPVADLTKPVLKKDLRGVGCPINFVKTKIALEPLSPGQILEVWLDDGEPIDNVPGSVSAEGHKILSKNRVEKYWSLLIQKV